MDDGWRASTVHAATKTTLSGIRPRRREDIFHPPSPGSAVGLAGCRRSGMIRAPACRGCRVGCVPVGRVGSAARMQSERSALPSAKPRSGKSGPASGWRMRLRRPFEKCAR